MYKLPIKKTILLRVVTCVIVFFALIGGVVAGFHIVYARTYVKGISMLPTLNCEYQQTGKRDVVYINRFAKVKVNDIVVLDLRSNNHFGNYAVKRLIATEGDIVNITFDNDLLKYNLVVNNQIVQSKPHKTFGYSTYARFNQYIEMHEGDTTRISKNEQNQTNGVIIKAGEIFVLGDNWDESKDSSEVGPLSKKTIVGRVDIVIKPSQNEFLTILKRIF